MDIITQTMYKGLYASGGGGDLIIYCTLYLNEDFSDTVNLLKTFETIRDFKRFRFVPHYSWLTGIYEFRKAENGIPEIQDHLHEYNEIKHSTLKSLINRVANTELNRDIPWWDLHLIHLNKEEKYNEIDNKFKSVLVFRFHHAICDGITFIRCIVPKLFTDKNGETLTVKLNKPTRNAQSCCSIPGSLIHGFWESLVISTRRIPSIPVYNSMKPNFGTQILHHHSMYLTKLKTIHNYFNKNSIIRNKFNIDYHISFNDIIMSFSAGALRKVLINNGSDEYIKNINEYTNIYSLLVTAETGAVKSNKLSNKWACLSVPYFINICDNIQRILTTAQGIKPLKNPWTTLIITEMTKNLTRAWDMNIRGGTSKIQAGHACCYSMLRGPMNDDEIYICKNKIIDIGVAAGDLKHSQMQEILLFGDKISLNITVDEQAIQYATDWTDGFENIVINTLNELNQIIDQEVAKSMDSENEPLKIDSY